MFKMNIQEGGRIQEQPVSLYVARIPIAFNKEGLRNLFSTCGRVISVRLHMSKNSQSLPFGFVEFSTHEEAQRAIMKHNMKPPFNLQVSFARNYRREENVVQPPGCNFNNQEAIEQLSAKQVDMDELKDIEMNDKDLIPSFQNLLITVNKNEEGRRVSRVRALSERPEFSSGSDIPETSRELKDDSPRNCTRRSLRYTERDLINFETCLPHQSPRAIADNGNNCTGAVLINSAIGDSKPLKENVPRPPYRENYAAVCESQAAKHNPPLLPNPCVLPEPKEFNQLVPSATSQPYHLSPDRVPYMFGNPGAVSLQQSLQQPLLHQKFPRNTNENTMSRECSVSFSIGHKNIAKEHQDRERMSAALKMEDHGEFGMKFKVSTKDSHSNELRMGNGYQSELHSEEKFGGCLNDRSYPNKFNTNVPRGTITEPKFLRSQDCPNSFNLRRDKVQDAANGNITSESVLRRNDSYGGAKPRTSPDSYPGKSKIFNRMSPMDPEVNGSHSLTNAMPSRGLIKTTCSRPQLERGPSCPSLKVVQLPMNGNVQVIITNLTDRDVWVQLCTDMVTEIQHYPIRLSSILDKTPNLNFMPTPGCLCAAKYSEDDQWYRGQIKEIRPDGRYLVFFLDYGNVEVTTKDRLSAIPEEFLSLPAQAIKCAFTGFSNPKLAITKVVWVRMLKMEGDVAIVTPVKPSNIDTGASLEHSASTRPLQKTPQFLVTSTLISDLKLEAQVQICVTVSGENKFWGHLVVERTQEVMELIALTLDFETPTNNDKSVDYTGIVAAYSSHDKAWYRAICLPSANQDQRKVFYLDFGNEEEVTHFKKLPDNLKTCPSMVVHCTITEVSDETNKLYLKNNVVADKNIFFVTKKFLGDSALGHIVKPDGSVVAKARLSPWYLLVKIPKAQPRHIVDEKGDQKDVPALPSPVGVQNHGDPNGPSNGLVVPEAKKEKTKVLSKLRISDLPELKIPPDESHEVILALVTEPDIIYVLFKAFLYDIGEMTNKIRDACQENKLSYVPERGELVCAKFSSDNGWYRGEVKNVSVGTADIWFIDYGNEENVPFEKIQHYPTDILYPAFAMKVSLSNAWSPFLSELKTYENKEILMTVKNSGTIPWKVEFSDIKTKTPLFVPVPASTEVHEMPQNTPISNGPVQCNKSIERLDAPSPNRETIPSPRDIIGPTDSVINLLPKVNLKNGETYSVSITAVTDENDIYVCLQDDIIDKLKLGMQLRKNCSLLNGRPFTPELFDLVIAKSQTDTSYYRAEVRKILPNNKAAVHFIDCGNSDILDFSYLWEIPPIAFQYPIYARKVVAKNIGNEHLPTLKQRLVNTTATMKVLEGAESIPVVQFLDENNQPLFHTNCPSQETVNSETTPREAVRENNEIKIRSPVKIIEQASAPTSKRPTLADLKHRPLTTGSKEKVMILFEHDNKNVSVAPHEFLEDLGQVLQQLTDHCTNVDHEPYVPLVGEIVCACFTDEMWYRSEVKRMGKNIIEVQYVDFGNSHSVTASKIRKLPAEIKDYPVLSVCVKVTPYSTTSIEINKEFVMEVIDSSSDPIVVAFYDENTLSEFSKPTEDLPSAPQSLNSISDVYNLKLTDMELITLPVGTAIRPLAVLSIHDPKNIYCTLLETDIMMAASQLEARIKDHCNSVRASGFVPVPGNMCLSKFETDGCWYRANCLECGSKSCKVLFVDYGNIETVSLENILPMESCFMKDKVQAVRCMLSNLVPTEGWSEEMCSRLKDIIQVNVPLDARVVSRIEDAYVIEFPSLTAALQESGILAAE